MLWCRIIWTFLRKESLSFSKDKTLTCSTSLNAAWRNSQFRVLLGAIWTSRLYTKWGTQVVIKPLASSWAILKSIFLKTGTLQRAGNYRQQQGGSNQQWRDRALNTVTLEDPFKRATLQGPFRQVMTRIRSWYSAIDSSLQLPAMLQGT